MNPYGLLAAVAGAVAMAGVLLAVVWFRGGPRRPEKTRTAASKVLGSGVATERRRKAITAGAAVVATVAVWLISGWPVAGIGAGAAVLFLPGFFMVGRIVERRIDRLEALEEWVRRLADTMAAGNAAVSTIVRSAGRAPSAIRDEVEELASRLSTQRWDRVAALRQFANRIDDSLADLIALALEISVTARSSDRVPGVLRQVADAAAEEVRARRQIEVDRNAPRKEARLLLLVFVGGAVGIVLFTDYARTYATPAGQAWLALLLLLLGVALYMIRRLSMGEKTPRILASVDLERSERDW